MTLGARVVLAFLALTLIVFAWLFRIDAKPVTGPAGTSVFVTNRWTGTVYYCNVRPECTVIYP